MAQIQKIKVEIGVDIKIPLWTAIKLRIAGKASETLIAQIVHRLETSTDEEEID